MNNNWIKTSLGELQESGLASIQTGPFGTVLKASEYSEHGSPVISVGEIKKGFLLVSGRTPTVSEETKKRLPQFVLQSGDIVFGRKGAIDRNAIVSEEQSGWFLGSDGIRLRLSQDIDSVFVSQQLRTSAVGKWLLQNSTGSVMSSLNQQTLDRLPIWLPESLDQQRKIAAVLSALDAKIACNNSINAELEAMAKTLYDYWFVQFDFPYDFAQGRPDPNGKPYRTAGGKMVYNPTLKREIPEGWEAKLVGEVLSTAPRRQNVPSKIILTEGTIPVIDQSVDYICGFTDDENTRLKVKSAHIVFGDHTRILKLINFDYARGADGTQVLIPDRENLPPHLFYQMLKDIDLSNYGYARHFKFLKESLIILPDEDVAMRYESAAKAIYMKVRHGIMENQHLTQLRDWLLPLLMNGQVTVA
jgi:type I restriction enzyme S subunit